MQVKKKAWKNLLLNSLNNKGKNYYQNVLTAKRLDIWQRIAKIRKYHSGAIIAKRKGTISRTARTLQNVLTVEKKVIKQKIVQKQ